MRFLLIVLLVLGIAAEAHAARVVKETETWSGKILLEGTVSVPRGAVLVIEPGAELRFAANAVLLVEGRLVAKGTAEKPVLFHAAEGSKPGAWQGISFQETDPEISDLEHVRIEDAVQAIAVTGSEVRIAVSTLRNGSKGLITGIGARVRIEQVHVSDMSEGGIEASVRSQVRILGCRFENIAGFGIQAGQQAQVLVRGNHISGAQFGILLNGDFPPLEDNVLEHCELGIGLAQSGPGSIVRGNRVAGAKTGIACRQFASPTIQGNIIEECEEGINCFQGASPAIVQNRFARNQRALACIQMCNPVVTRNDFMDNDCAAYLHLSSYAQFHDNNFEGNRLHIELDNMSYDWEVRAGMKPTRNRQKQSEIFMRNGKAASKDVKVEIESEGFVNAKGNYWGKDTTAEMEAKGPEANISTIQDGFDVPTRTYEGWPGEYLQDRVRYEGWKKERIPGTGPASRPEAAPVPR